MKKLVFLLTAVVMTAFGTSVYAQSTGENPAPGATHSYFITPGDAGNNIAWSIVKSDLSPSDAGTITTIESDSISIAWADTVTVGDWYYVQVVETDGTCSNTKILPVQIAESDFTLTLAATNATACYDNAVSVSIVSNAPVYEHGTATLEFTVTPDNLSSSYDGYEFDMSMTVPAGFSSTPTFSTNASWNGTTVTVTDNNAVTISYEVENGNTYDNNSDADAQDFTATVEITNGKSANGVSENNTDDDNTDSTEVSRPNTSGIGTN